MTSYRMRMGDGMAVEMTADEIRRDVAAGTEDAADRGRIAPLSVDEQEHLFDLLTRPGRLVGVRPGDEVVLSDDGCVNALYGAQSSSGVGVPVSREMGIRIYERAFGFDTMELGHVDYSFKPVKPIIAMEQQAMESVLHATIVPMFYGAMPNLALYARPDGPFGNPADLLPAGKITEAQEAQLEAAEFCRRDMVYVARKMAEVGADAINFDTTASAGDVEFLATLAGGRGGRRRRRPRHRGGDGRRVRAGHARRGHVRRRASGRPVPARPGQVGREGGGPRLRSGGQHQHAALGPVEHRPGGDLRQGDERGGHHPHPRQRGHGRGGRAHDRDRRPSTPWCGPAWPWSSWAGWTDYRWARAIPTGCPRPMRSPPGWEASAPPEIWWPGCSSAARCGSRKRRRTWPTSSR